MEGLVRTKKLGIGWLVFLILLAVCEHGQCQQVGVKMQKLNLNEPFLENWLEQSLSLPESQFVPAQRHAALLFEYLEQSRGTTGVFLEKRADPWRGANAGEWKAHAANPGGIDLLRNEYTADGVKVLLLEGRNLMLIRAIPLGPSLAETKNKRELLNDMIKKIVKTNSLEHHWQFRLPNDLDTSWEQRLISNERAPQLRDLASRHERADILLWDGAVHFIFYKRIEQLESFLPSDTWFSAQTRATLNADQQVR